MLRPTSRLSTAGATARSDTWTSCFSPSATGCRLLQRKKARSNTSRLRSDDSQKTVCHSQWFRPLPDTLSLKPKKAQRRSPFAFGKGDRVKQPFTSAAESYQDGRLKVPFKVLRTFQLRHTWWAGERELIDLYTTKAFVHRLFDGAAYLYQAGGVAVVGCTALVVLACGNSGWTGKHMIIHEPYAYFMTAEDMAKN